MMLKEILSDLVSIDDILFVIRANGVTGEIRSDTLDIFEREKYINLGDNDGPCHMHISKELIKRAEFITEQKPERISFSVRFFDEYDKRVLACFFTKMYDDNGELKEDKKQLFDELCTKYNQKIIF